jgi:hypothetical protein
MMDWLDAAALFVLGWFVEKVRRLAKRVLDVIWFLIWCTSTIRCLITGQVYGLFLKQAADLRDAGRLRGTPLRAVQRFESWASPKMEAWMERTGPGTPAWQKTTERQQRRSAAS